MATRRAVCLLRSFRRTFLFLKFKNGFHCSPVVLFTQREHFCVAPVIFQRYNGTCKRALKVRNLSLLSKSQGCFEKIP